MFVYPKPVAAECQVEKHSCRKNVDSMERVTDAAGQTNESFITEPPSAMRQYLIDELSFLEHDNLEHFLKHSLKHGPITGVYWLELPQDLLAPPQLAHPDCGPFYFSVILEKSELRAEFLVRSSHNMHCSCIDWATSAQRQFILDYIDKLLKKEFIAV